MVWKRETMRIKSDSLENMFIKRCKGYVFSCFLGSASWMDATHQDGNVTKICLMIGFG